MVAARRLELAAEVRNARPGVLGGAERRWRMALARDVRAGAAAACVAGIRQPRRGVGVRRMARPAPADRS